LRPRPSSAAPTRSCGAVGRRADGRFGFVRIEQAVELETDDGHEAAARALVEKAEEGCLVAVSLDLPVETSVAVRTAVGAAS
jgi:organic hydroperoxide reductase OsmC/OhrA